MDIEDSLLVHLHGGWQWQVELIPMTCAVCVCGSMILECMSGYSGYWSPIDILGYSGWFSGRLVFVSGFPQSLKIGDARPYECTSRPSIGGCRAFPV